MEKIWGKYGNGKTVAKQWQNVGIDKNFFIFFVFSPRPSLSISRGEKFFSKSPAEKVRLCPFRSRGENFLKKFRQNALLFSLRK